MTDMTLEQVRDELRRLASDGGFGQMADAIDAHLAKAAQGEAVAWQYRRDGVEWHPLKEEFIEKAIRDGVEVRALYAASAQPVEAVAFRGLRRGVFLNEVSGLSNYPLDPKCSAGHVNCEWRSEIDSAGTVRRFCHECNGYMPWLTEYAASAFDAALAHPRPTGDVLIIPQDPLPSSIDALKQDDPNIARAAMLAFAEREMGETYGAGQFQFSTYATAPTGEQAEAVAWRYRSPAQVEFGRPPSLTDDAELVRLMREAGGHEIVDLAPAQPRAVGVPDGWEVDGSGHSIAIRSKDGRKAVLRNDIGFTYTDRIVYDFITALIAKANGHE